MQEQQSMLLFVDSSGIHLSVLHQGIFLKSETFQSQDTDTHMRTKLTRTTSASTLEDGIIRPANLQPLGLARQKRMKLSAFDSYSFSQKNFMFGA